MVPRNAARRLGDVERSAYPLTRMQSARGVQLFEPVFTLTEWYDGPRKGIACYHGKPHLYESRWSNLETDLEDTFLLMPLTAEIVALALEDWAIWKRWRAAYDRKEVTLETHPALPPERKRHNEVAVILQTELQIQEEMSFCVQGEFKAPETDQYELMVKWNIVSCDEFPDRRNKVSL